MRSAVLVFLLLLSVPLYSQVDTEFWFAPPEVSEGHGDRPIFLRLSTLDQSAQIRIYLPALQSEPIWINTLPSSTSVDINLTNRVSQLETKPSNTVLKTGLRIVATSPITAYYEVSSTWNVDIFVLKGKNALGNNFIIPGQNVYSNGQYTPLPYFSFDIVATRNNTVVFVNPTNPVAGNPTGEEMLIKLNRGETYSIRRSSLSANVHLGGTSVRSNKPIAITLKDDSVIDSGCRDLLGDQMVPVKVAGKEYVVIRGFLDNGEYAFITGIEDNTDIFINGATSPTATINKGELYRYRLTQNATHILSDKSIYVIHVTGFGCEAGMALLPSVNCRGSTQIGFTRSTTEFFGMNILVRSEGVGNFELNGSSTAISASDFSPVPGTDDAWYSAQMSFANTSSGVPVGQASLISNSTHSFQIGVVNGGAGSSCRYGYFSSFATLFIGDDLALCPFESEILDAGSDKDDYLWSDGSVGQFLEVSEPGTYWVNTTKENCVLSDTITVEIKAATLELGADQTFCVGDTIKIDGQENFSWDWSDGSTDRYLATTEPGTYTLEISNFTGCTASDDITVTHRETPTVDLGDDILKCPDEEATLDATYPGASYTWSTGEFTNTITALDSGSYDVRVAFGGCFAYDTLSISLLEGPPQDTIYGSPSVCPFVTEVDYFTDTSSNATYSWQVAGGTIVQSENDSIKIDWGDTNANAEVSLIVTGSNGCETELIDFPVSINRVLDVRLPSGPDSLCLNFKDQNMYEVGFTNGSVYDWQITGGTIVDGQGSYKVAVDWDDVGDHTLQVSESSTTLTDVCDGTSDILEIWVYEDTTRIHMENATVEDGRIYVQWNTNDPDRILEEAFFLSRWTQGQMVPDFEQSIDLNFPWFTDVSTQPQTTRYDYQVSATNLCLQELLTTVHSAVLLQAEKDTIQGILDLGWSSYEGWTQGVQQFELYRKLDGAGLELIQSFGPAQFDYQLDATDGFRHELVIRSVNSDGVESWSNVVVEEFDHPITFIPNVITPNGDAFNQRFIIPKIHLYPQSVLTIIDRWGREVFKERGYKNTWEGESLNPGTYFYSLWLPTRDEAFRGTITVAY